MVDKERSWVVRSADGSAVGAHPSREAAEDCLACRDTLSEGGQISEEETEIGSDDLIRHG